MNSCSQKTPPFSAFTLIELLIVIAVIGVLAALSISAFSGSSQVAGNLNTAGNTASGLAQLARQQAMTLNTKTVLVLAQVNDNGTPRSAMSIWDAVATNQIEKWNLLPQAVLATNTSADVSATADFVCNYRGQNLTGVGYAFMPDGRMGDGNAVPRLRIQPRQGGVTNFYDLIFSPLTGNAKTVRP